MDPGHLGNILARDAAPGPALLEKAVTAKGREARSGIFGPAADRQVPTPPRGRGGRPATGRTTRAYAFRLPLQWVQELERQATEEHYRGGKAPVSKFLERQVIRLLSGAVLVKLSPEALATLERRARRLGITPAHWASQELETRLSKEARPGQRDRGKGR